jgi:uncharacterized protein with PIN domain
MNARYVPDCPLCGMKFGEEEDHHARESEEEVARRLRGLEERLHALERGEAGPGIERADQLCPSCRRSFPEASRGAGREQVAREVREEIERLRDR